MEFVDVVFGWLEHRWIVDRGVLQGEQEDWAVALCRL
jgi:hypothetical protein